MKKPCWQKNIILGSIFREKSKKADCFLRLFLLVHRGHRFEFVMAAFVYNIRKLITTTS